MVKHVLYLDQQNGSFYPNKNSVERSTKIVYLNDVVSIRDRFPKYKRDPLKILLHNYWGILYFRSLSYFGNVWDCNEFQPLL